MGSDTASLVSLGFAVLLLWGYLSGGFVGRPQLRRNLLALRDAISRGLVGLVRLGGDTFTAICRACAYAVMLAVTLGLPLYFLVRFIKWAWAD